VPSNETHGTFDDILALAPPSLRPVCESLRRLIADKHPTNMEVVWPALKIASYGVGPRKMTEHYAYMAVQGSHINLGFYDGASLNDPTGLLEGTGKKLRHIKIRELSTAESAPVAELLRQSIADLKRALAGRAPNRS
jgi:hypothetical protein